MKVQLLGSDENDVYIPMDITNEPYRTEWEGEFNEDQLMWTIKYFPSCEIKPWKTFDIDKIQVIGLTIALGGFRYGED